MGDGTRSEAPMSDHIRLTGLAFYAHHGVNAEEASQGQRFLVDVDVATDTLTAGRSDALADTVNYSLVFRAVRDVMDGPRRNLLESLAEQIAARVLALPHVQEVRVTIHKPQAPLKGAVFQDVSVEVERRRAPRE